MEVDSLLRNNQLIPCIGTINENDIVFTKMGGRQIQNMSY